jgi:hypothetical protein
MFSDLEEIKIHKGTFVLVVGTIFVAAYLYFR